MSKHAITSISFHGGFLDGQRFKAADGLNCVIGARGTGKTTVLEFVRYAFGRMPEDAAARKRIESLVQGNLRGGRVQVGVRTKEGLSYVVSRSAGEEPVVLTAEGEPTEISLSQLGGLFGMDLFSQNEIETIADQSESQLELIDNFEAEHIADIEYEIRAIKAEIATNANRIVPHREKLVALSDELAGLPGIEEKLKAFTEEGSEDSNAINEAHALKALRDRERRAVQSASQRLRDVLAEVQRIADQVTAQPFYSPLTREMFDAPNAEVLRELGTGLESCGTDVVRILNDAAERIRVQGQTLDRQAGQLDLAHKKQELRFQELIDRHQEAQGRSTERARLERHRNDLLAMEHDRKQAEEALKDLQGKRTALLERLSELRDKRFHLREEIVKKINDALSETIRVSIAQFGNLARYQELLEHGLKGSGMKHRQVTEKLARAFSPERLVAAISERDTDSLVDKAGVNNDQAGKILASLVGSEILFELEVVELVDRPTIELNDEGTYKETTELSTGQKCTTILPILLLDRENPLLIDQPEDNLDNRFVCETIVDSLIKVKQSRQLFFVTHNPNIPVLGDAEKVFVLQSDGKSASLINEGTVDDCRKDIVKLLEGGEDAFRRRGERYKVKVQ